MEFINNFLTRLRLSYRLLRDERVSLLTKLIPIIVMVYLISPLDLIPFMPIDDIAILLGGMRLFEALVPDYIVYEHRSELGMEFEAK